MTIVDIELLALIEQLHAEAHHDAKGASWPRRLCTEQVCRDITLGYADDWPGSRLDTSNGRRIR